MTRSELLAFRERLIDGRLVDRGAVQVEGWRWEDGQRVVQDLSLRASHVPVSPFPLDPNLDSFCAALSR
jgi:hypothetical protein